MISGLATCSLFHNDQTNSLSACEKNIFKIDVNSFVPKTQKKTVKKYAMIFSELHLHVQIFIILKFNLMNRYLYIFIGSPDTVLVLLTVFGFHSLNVPVLHLQSQEESDTMAIATRVELCAYIHFL